MCVCVCVPCGRFEEMRVLVAVHVCKANNRQYVCAIKQEVNVFLREIINSKCVDVVGASSECF